MDDAHGGKSIGNALAMQQEDRPDASDLGEDLANVVKAVTPLSLRGTREQAGGRKLRRTAPSPVGRSIPVRTFSDWDDSGYVFDAALPIDANETVLFNPDDLETGSEAKGMQGIGSGVGDWRPGIANGLNVEAPAYVRTGDGFLTSMLDVVPRIGHRHCKEDALSHSQQHGSLVVESLSGGLVMPRASERDFPSSVMTMLVDYDAIQSTGAAEIGRCPRLFQRGIPKAYEVRAVVVAGDVFAFRIDSQRLRSSRTDWRHAIDHLDFRPIRLPDAIEDRLPTIHARPRPVFRQLRPDRGPGRPVLVPRMQPGRPVVMARRCCRWRDRRCVRTPIRAEAEKQTDPNCASPSEDA